MDGFASSSIVGAGRGKDGGMYGEEGPVEPNERISSVIREKSYRHHLRLLITNIQSSDYGVYKCMAKNEYGTQEGLITLFGMHRIFNELTLPSLIKLMLLSSPLSLSLLNEPK